MSEQVEQRQTYCGIRPCGCVVVIISRTAPDVEAHIAAMREQGMSVELLPAKEAISRVTCCKCGPKPAQLVLFEEAA